MLRSPRGEGGKERYASNGSISGERGNAPEEKENNRKKEEKKKKPPPVISRI